MILLMLVGDKGEVSHSCTRVHDTGYCFFVRMSEIIQQCSVAILQDLTMHMRKRAH